VGRKGLKQNIMNIHEIIREQRHSRFKDSKQLSLGQFIKQLEALDLKYDEETYKEVEFDFCGTVPTVLDSWRGSYDELALGWATGYEENAKADKLLAHLKSAVGLGFEGYKGGYFKMTENTPVWVANYGRAGDTAVVGVLDVGYKIVILTAWCEY
jgi:hypothetical protein